MTDEQLINVGKALVSMLERMQKGDITGTSLENNLAYFEKDGQIYRVHLSKIEEPWVYNKGLHVVEDEDNEEDVKSVTEVTDESKV
jgi:hypothetical protein